MKRLGAVYELASAFLMLPLLLTGGGALLLLWQTEPTDAALTTILTTLIQTLTVGGGLTGAGTFILRELGKRLDEQRTREAEDRADERAERERTYAAFARRVEDLTTENRALMERYIAREQRGEERLVTQAEAWRNALEDERERNTALRREVIDWVHAGLLPAIRGELAKKAPETLP